MINRFSLKNNIPLISASATGFYIQIVQLSNQKNKHLCLECLFPNENEPDLARCDTVGILGTAAGLAGIISAQKTINFLMKFNNIKNLLTLIDSKTLTLDDIRITKNTKCQL